MRPEVTTKVTGPSTQRLFLETFAKGAHLPLGADTPRAVLERTGGMG
jgi:hypothetical protein